MPRRTKGGVKAGPQREEGGRLLGLVAGRVLRRSVLARGLPAEFGERVTQAGRAESRPRRALLYRRGDPADRAYLVLSGRVRSFRSAGTGREVTLGHRLAGSLVGEWGLLGMPTQGESAEVAEEASLLVLPVRSILPLIQTEAKVLRALTTLAARRREDAEAKLEAVLFRTVRSRLAAFLLDGIRRDGAADPRGTRIRSRYSHYEIATTVGATRETVTLTLAEMKRKGVVVVERRRIIVRDEAKLRALV